MKKLLTLLLLIPFLGFGQWVKIFEGNDVVYGFGVVQVADSGFVLQVTQNHTA